MFRSKQQLCKSNFMNIAKSMGADAWSISFCAASKFCKLQNCQAYQAACACLGHSEHTYHSRLYLSLNQCMRSWRHGWILHLLCQPPSILTELLQPVVVVSCLAVVNSLLELLQLMHLSVCALIFPACWASKWTSNSM